MVDEVHANYILIHRMSSLTSAFSGRPTTRAEADRCIWRNMSKIKDGFKFGVGFVSVIILAAIIFGVFPAILDKFISKEKYSSETGVKLVTVKHWLANEKLTFVGEISYEGEIFWKDLRLSFVLSDEEGDFIGRCKDSLFRPFEFSNKQEFRAQCYDLPSDFKFAKYKFEVFGKY